MGALGVSVGNSNFVLFSEAWKQGDQRKAFNTLKQAIHLGLFLQLPVAVMLWALALLSVQIVFERGAFSPNDSLYTAGALKFYTLGIPCHGLHKILAPVFYTLDREKIPVMTSVVSIVFNIVFCVTLVPLYGFEILALGMGLSLLLNVTMLLFFLNRDSHFSWNILLNKRVAKLFLSAAFCGLVIVAAMDQLPLAVGSLGEKIVSLIVYGSLGGVSYLVALMVLGEGAMIKRMASRVFKVF